MSRLIVYIFIIFFLSSCLTRYEHSGYVLDKQSLSSLQKGKSDKDNVLQTLGAPTVISSIPPESWFYMSEDSKRLAFLRPNLLQTEYIQIKFSPDDKISSIFHKSNKLQKNIEICDDYTETKGDDTNPFKEIISNIGRYKK
jgi:outer membrane protein assembly factor BamE (lipoprotein component of BamABCDE complex)